MHGDGPIEEKNISNGNIFFSVLASQQENMNDDINKLKAEHKVEFDNLKKVQEILLTNIDVMTHKMNYVITNCEQILADNRSTHIANLEKFREVGVGLKVLNDKVYTVQKTKVESIKENNFQPNGRMNSNAYSPVCQSLPKGWKISWWLVLP